MTAHSHTHLATGRSKLRSMIALGVAIALGLTALVVAPAPPASAAGTGGLTHLGTLGGPQHAQIYSSGLETSATDNTLVVADTGNNQIVKFDQAGNELWRVGEWGAGNDQYDNPRDVAVDAAGNIFVIDTRNSRIVKLDTNGTWLEEFDKTATVPDTGLEINFPMGGTITDGILYVADNGRKRVLGIDTSDWSIDREIVRDDAGSNTVCQNMAGIRDAEADSAGNIYVAGYSTNEIAKVAPDDTCTSWGSTGSGDGQFRTPYGVRVATDPVLGRDILYVADALNFRVQTFELDGTFIDKFGVEGTPDQQGTISTMRRAAVATDGSGDVWAADLWGFKVERYDRTPAGYTWAQEIGTPYGAATDNEVFHEPREVGITTDGGGNTIVNVIDTVHHRYASFNALDYQLDPDDNPVRDENGNFVMTGGDLIGQPCGTRATAGAELGKFNWPRGLEVDKTTNEIWVADTKQHRIQIMGPNCTGVEFIGGAAGDGDGEFFWPYALDIDDQGTPDATDDIAFIADTENHRIKAYRVHDRAYLGQYGTRGDGWNQLEAPQGVVVHPTLDNRVVVSDTLNNRIKVISYNVNGNSITFNTDNVVNDNPQFGRTFNHPEGIAVDDDAKIYVADSGANRIVILDPGNYKELNEITTTGNRDFNHPAAVTIDGDFVYVSDTLNDRVEVFTKNPPVTPNPPPYVSQLAGPAQAAMYPSGFEYDALNDQLVVADTGLNRILRYDLDGTKVSEFGEPGSDPGQLESPRDAAVDGSGNIYVADAENSRIQKFDASGNLQWTQGARGTCGPCLHTPIGITYDAANDQVLVAASSYDRIKAWNPDGSFAWDSGDIGLNGPRDVARGPDGRIWVADYKNHRIKAFDDAGTGNFNATPVFELGGAGDGDLNFPYNTVWDATGNRMYVSDTGTGRIVSYDFAGGNWNLAQEWAGRCGAHPGYCPDPGAPDFEPGKFNHLRRVTVDAAGKVYGLDFWGNGIEVFNADGTYSSSIEGATAGVPGFAQPHGVDVDADGNVYVMERLNHRVQKFDRDGNYVTHTGSRGTALGTFSWPEAVAADDNGNVFAVDTRGGEIHQYDATLGSTPTDIGQPPSGALNGPEGASVNGDMLWIADTYNDRIVPYNITLGQFGTAFGTEGSGPGKFQDPQGVTATDTHVFVADSGNNRIQKLALDGTYVAEATNGLKAPEGIDVDADGNVWVADTGAGRIRHFSGDEAGGTELADLGDSSEPDTFKRPHDVAVGNGFLYVTDTHNHTVEKFRVGENSVSLDVTATGQEISDPAGVAQLYPGGGVSDGSDWYVADSGNSRIVKIDSGRNVSVVSDQGWDDPRTVAADPDGTHLWVGDQTNGDNKVVKITKSGNVVSELRGTGLDGPWGVAVDNSGVYVADTYNQRVVKINPAGDTEIWAVTSFGGTNLSRPRTVAIGDDGNVYVGDSDNDRVLALNPTTGAEIGSFATVARPRAIAADGSGGLWVGNAQNLQLAHVQTDGTQIAAPIGGYGTGAGQFRQPSGIFMDGNDVVVSDQWAFQLQRFTVNGGGAPSHAETIGGTEPAAGGFNGPFGLTYDANAKLYVADWFNHRVQRFNADKTFDTQWGAYGTNNDSYIFPRAIAIAADGTAVVTDSENNRLALINTDGSQQPVPTPANPFSRPHQTAIAADGSFWVADTLNNRVLHTDTGGATLGEITGAEIVNPRGVATDSAGKIYVANDGAEDTITKYAVDGTLIGTIATKGTGAGELKDPHNLAVATFGDAEVLFVADAGNNRVQILGTSGAPIDSFGTGLDSPKAVAVAPGGGALAVSDHGNNRVVFYDISVTEPTPPDTTAPDGTVTTPVDKQEYHTSAIGTLDGTATDDASGSGIAEVTVAIKNRDTNEWLKSDGTFSAGIERMPATLDAAGSISTNWSFDWTPVVGRFGVSVGTTDGAGNQDPTKPWIFFDVTDVVADTTPPDNTVSAPVDGTSYAPGTLPQFAGTATDNVGVASVEVAIKNTDTGQYWDGAAWGPTTIVKHDATLANAGAAATGWTYDWTPPADGNFGLSVITADTTGNSDPDKPWVTFSVGAQDQADPNAGVDVPVNNTTYYQTQWPQFSGLATDDIGVAEVNIAIKNKATGEWWNGTTAAFEPGFRWGGDATLSAPGADSTGWTYSIPAPASSDYAMMVRAEDTAGNLDPTKPWVNFSYEDILPPVDETIEPNATVDAPVNGTTYQETSFTGFSGNATDAGGSGVAEVEVAIKNRDTNQWWTGSAWGGWTMNAATLDNPGTDNTDWSLNWNEGPGNYAISVRATDGAGNQDPTKPWVSFSLTDAPTDGVAPDGTVTSPLNNQIFGLGTINLNGEATDNIGVDRVRVAIKNKASSEWWTGSAWQAGFRWVDTTLGSPGNSPTTWSYAFTPPAAGNFAVLVRAEDAAGNMDPTKPWINFSAS